MGFIEEGTACIGGSRRQQLEEISHAEACSLSLCLQLAVPSFSLTFFIVFSLPHRVLELQTFVNGLGDICSFNHGLSHCISPFLSPSVSGSSEVSLPVLFIYTYLCGCHIIQVQR